MPLLLIFLLTIIIVFRLNLKQRYNGTKIYNGTKTIEIRVRLKYLSNFWRTLKMPLINLEIDLALTCTARYFIIDDPVVGQEPTFTKTEL